MPPKWGIFPKDRHIAHFLKFSTKGIFLLMVPRDLNAVLTLVHAAETVNLLFGPNPSPKKVSTNLVSPKPIRIAPNRFFWGARTESEVLLCWGRCTKVSPFLGEGVPTHPSPQK